MILVTAAAGNQGRLLVPKLLRAGVDVRACVLSQESAQRLRQFGATDVIVGDICDPAVAAAAVDQVDAVYHVGPTLHPQERGMGMGLINAARAAGVRHFVFSSVLHSILTDLVQHQIKRDIEEHLLSSDLEFTILQPANFMLPLKLVPVFTRGVFELSWSLDRKQSMIDLADLTDVAVDVLTAPEQHAGATYELVAPGRYTGHDLRGILERVLGRPVQAREIDADTYLRAWVGDHDPAQFPHQTRVLRSITARYSAHDFVGNPNVLTWLLGREPTSFEDYVRRQWAAHQQTTT